MWGGGGVDVLTSGVQVTASKRCTFLSQLIAEQKAIFQQGMNADYRPPPLFFLLMAGARCLWSLACSRKQWQRGWSGGWDVGMHREKFMLWHQVVLSVSHILVFFFPQMQSRTKSAEAEVEIEMCVRMETCHIWGGSKGGGATGYGVDEQKRKRCRYGKSLMGPEEKLLTSCMSLFPHWK